jgi:two-component system, LuxR family, response regulator DctR
VSSAAIEPVKRFVHVVDDDAAVADALGLLLQARGWQTEIYARAEAFAEALPAAVEQEAVVLLDVRMPGISGVQLFDDMLSEYGRSPLPVIFLTGHADVPMAVEALKKGAFDFVEKPFDAEKLVRRIGDALEHARQNRAELKGARSIRDALASLTEREQEVMKLIVAGRLNKVIADELGISMRTVEVHRSRIFVKMGVRGAVELANLLKIP